MFSLYNFKKIHQNTIVVKYITVLSLFLLCFYSNINQLKVMFNIFTIILLIVILLKFNLPT